MAFKFGKSSLNELKGVHADLVAVVQGAIQITVQDFSVHDGIRSIAEQKNLLQQEPHRRLIHAI